MVFCVQEGEALDLLWTLFSLPAINGLDRRLLVVNRLPVGHRYPSVQSCIIKHR